MTDGTQVLTSVKRLKAAPGEMEKITLKAAVLQAAGDTVTVNLEVIE